MPKGYRTCSKCNGQTRSVLGSPTCVHCQEPFEPTAPVKRIWTDEEIAACRIKKFCEPCQAWTPGGASKFCRLCNAPFERKKKHLFVPASPPSEEVVSEATYVPPAPIELPPEITHVSEKWEYPPNFTMPFHLDIENASILERPCPFLFEFEGDFPDDSIVENWAHDVRQSLMLRAAIYPNNACLWFYLRGQIKNRFPDGSDESNYLRLLIGALPDIKRKKKVNPPAANAA